MSSCDAGRPRPFGHRWMSDARCSRAAGVSRRGGSVWRPSMPRALPISPRGHPLVWMNATPVRDPRNPPFSDRVEAW